MNAVGLNNAFELPSDEELFARYRDRRDLAAIEELVHRYERELYSYLARYLRDPELAKEVFQTAFLHVVQKSKSFEDTKRFRPWLYSIATHAAIDMLRHRGRRQAASLDAQHDAGEGETATLAGLVPSATPGPVDEALLDERRRQVRTAVDALPEDLRSVLLLTYFQSLTYNEAAEALGIPLGTVKSRMHAALKRLGLALQDDELPLGK
ncbi:MAG TPA: sigma-70 family RNA polymerase sigma factor [Pirellulales bacterium]|jgi:RNA polymerase sigma-70 factor (ECF subfamily)